MSEHVTQGHLAVSLSEQLRDATTDPLGAPDQRKEMRLARAQR
jgi:hypothetical protein